MAESSEKPPSRSGSTHIACQTLTSSASLRHDPGLAASPPCRGKMEGEITSRLRVPAAMDESPRSLRRDLISLKRHGAPGSRLIPRRGPTTLDAIYDDGSVLADAGRGGGSWQSRLCVTSW